MPGKNGLELLRTLRSSTENKDLPIIILSGRDEQIDRLLGLEFGADDYITKPFDTRELVLRIKSVLKRAYSFNEARDSFHFGCLIMDFDSHSVMVQNKPINLTLTEFKLLSYLVADPGKTKSRDFFLEKIWGYGDGIYSRTIDTHIQRLRTKLNEAGRYIQTVRGVGYRFSID
jgi:two-component system phosphate regulon response regulator PhoB